MRVHAIIVSVDYAEHLVRSLERWAKSCTTVTVVTSFQDQKTKDVVELLGGVHLLQTNAFYDDGAYFNKGKAVQQAREWVYEVSEDDDWHLFVDADVVPPGDWMVQLILNQPQCGTLYGARRVRGEDGGNIPDHELAGFFQLYHVQDPRAFDPLATHFYHAGNYDSDFMLRWPHEMKAILPIEFLHYGEIGKNWCGKGNDKAMAELRKARRRGKKWRTELISSLTEKKPT